MTRRISVVVTARPSYARIKSALKAIQDHPDLELQLVLAASALLDRYGNVAEYIVADGFNTVARLFIILEGENLLTSAKSTGIGIMELATTFDNIKPDIVVTVADRFETLATAVSAAYLNIPLAHVQGGEITGSIDEKVRHSVTKLADYHFVSNEAAAERVRRLGEDPERVFVTGCPSIDLAKQVLENPEFEIDVFRQYGGVGESFDISGDFIVVMQHPVTTEVGDSWRQIEATLEAVESIGIPTIWFWPNVDAGSDGISRGIRIFREKGRGKNMHFFKNMLPEDFLRLLIHSRGIVGNSSVAIREASYLGVPAVNIGSRQAGRDRASNVVDVPYERSAIEDAIQELLTKKTLPKSTLYGQGDAGLRIAQCLADVELAIEKKLHY